MSLAQQNFGYHVLHEISKKKDLKSARQAHCFAVVQSMLSQSFSFDGESIIRMFTSFDKLFEATLVFSSIPKPSAHEWHSIILAHSINGHTSCVLELYGKMQEDGVQTNKFTFPCIVKSCSALSYLECGKLVHHNIMRDAVDSDAVITCALLDMYAKNADLLAARNLFDRVPKKDVALWGAMIAGYAQHGSGVLALQLYEKMRQEGFKPTEITVISALKACSSIRALIEGYLINDHIIRNHLESDIAVWNVLIDMYGKCGSLKSASRIFSVIESHNVVSYGAMITAFVQCDQNNPSFELFEKMVKKGIHPNKVIYINILKACGNMKALDRGMFLHESIIEGRFDTDVTVTNTIIDMYSKCGCIDEARRVFNLMPVRTTVSWGAMSSGYVFTGNGYSAIELYDEMVRLGVRPDQGSFVSVLKACAITGCITKGKIVHEDIMTSGITLDPVLGSSLIDMYVKCGDLDAAGKAFNILPKQDIVSWGALISGLVQHGQHSRSFELFNKMKQLNIKPDKVIFLSILKACSDTGAFNKGKLIHDEIKKMGLDLDMAIASSLITMYAKCGDMDEALRAFNKLPYQDEISWTALIAGYVHNGNYKQAKCYVEEMQKRGLVIQKVLPGILSALSHAKSASDHQNYFNSMAEEKPDSENFNCMVDLLGRSGQLNEAEEMLQSMPVPADIVGWTSLLTSCNLYGNKSLGKECYNNIVQIDPSASFGHVLMSNIYADAEMLSEMQEVHKERKQFPAWKKPAKAWIEIDTETHEFTVQDESHPQSISIDTSLNKVTRLIRQGGYIPQLNALSKV